MLKTLQPTKHGESSTSKNAATGAELFFRLAASDADLPALVHLAQEAHKESRFRYIPFNPHKVRKIARSAFKDQRRHAVMIAEKHGHAVGFVYCSVGEYHIGSHVLLTTIHNMNVSRTIRSSLSGGKIALGLFRGVETWSKARGAKEILFHVTSGVNLAQAHKLAKRIGYKFVGGSYVKTT
ncbi:hypothetical protein [uncultured Tateyamaria sp.]|uniref:GNAT family N-acetyltransferase n=1 Tax=uncultured Tateyamaria sp. TaxID=455651 RepID=UPI00260BD41A|nr:hypothetical protein [uncultured Tateyamaria sp.]